MTDIKPISTAGIIDKGDAFELAVATQVAISVSGSFKSAANAYVETELSWLSGPPRSQIISRTDLSSTTPSRFSNGASLRLGPGKYAFVGRIRAKPGGTLAAPNIEVAHATLFDNLNQAGIIGSASAYGSGNGFVMVSTAADSLIMAALRVLVKPLPDERFYATMRIMDVDSAEIAATPRVIQVGSNANPLETLGMPIALKAGRLYKFYYDLIYGGTAEIGAGISISG